ncbi:hypothetical protein ElyMa_005634600 [Elysia marginata]|uniref:Reverse transcriptase domain-containing protein n=1 Tax=Elysia marginata TaxID=1093978 RepID=A0AAV4F868_9GAST|nr:hypothetical protein ElyMa_005634600 [Elysia marginata]
MPYLSPSTSTREANPNVVTAGEAPQWRWVVALLKVAEIADDPKSLRKSYSTHLSEQILPEAQCGFRPGRSTIRSIGHDLCHEKFQEKCIKQNFPLLPVFKDLTKAFGTINVEALLIVLERIGMPAKIFYTIRLFHDGMAGQVLYSGNNVTGAFAISKGVKQDRVIVPALLNVLFSWMLFHVAMPETWQSGYCYSCAGFLFYLHYLTAKTKTLQSLGQVLFVDGCTLVAHTDFDLQMHL